MEFGALVALGFALGVFGLAGAELAKVFGRFGHHVFEELECDAAEGLACRVLSMMGCLVGKRRWRMNVSEVPRLHWHVARWHDDSRFSSWRMMALYPGILTSQRHVKEDPCCGQSKFRRLLRAATEGFPEYLQGVP